jgi:gliding motility-associated-like protein
MSYRGTVTSGLIYTYTWSLPPGAVTVNNTNGSDSAISVQFNTPGNQYVSLQVNDLAGSSCTTTDSALVNVKPIPSAGFYVKPEVCFGDTTTVALTYHSPDAYAYTWGFDSTIATVVSSSANTGGPYVVTFVDRPGLHILQMTPQSLDGCPGLTVTDTVNVYPLPDARINDMDNASPVCADDTVSFTATSYILRYSYQWMPAAYFNNDYNPYSAPYITGRIQQSGYISLTVTDTVGCKQTDSIYVNTQPCCLVVFPTAFTPNGDGRNDIFLPVTDGHHHVHIFRVANRWGQTVFETSNEEAGWDGKFNGVPQDMGVYFYYMKYDCNGQTLEKSGDVTLIR